MKLSAIFSRTDKVMSKVRAAALIATGIIAALMQSPAISTNVSVLQYMVYAQAVVAFVTKFTAVGDTKPPRPDPLPEQE